MTFWNKLVSRRAFFYALAAQGFALAAMALSRAESALAIEALHADGLEPVGPGHWLRQRHPLITVEYVYRGWAIWWTGWKHSFNTLDMAGQWAAYRISGLGGDWRNGKKIAYASAPGSQGMLRFGDVMDCGIVLEKQRCMLAGLATKRQLDHMRLDALNRLLGVIDKEKA